MTISQKAAGLAVSKKKAMSTTRATPSAMLMAWRCGSMIGLPDMRPSSLAKAMIEPGNVSAPMAAPSDISTRLGPWMAPGSPIPNA